MSWLAHAQLLDSAFPIGTFAHSFGLETLIQEGQVRTADDLRGYCCTLLHGAWAPCDALAVKAAYIFEDGELRDFDDTLHVARAAQETRDGQRKIGSRLLEWGRTLHPTLPWEAFLTANGTYPVVYGWICRQLKVELPRAATGLLYANMNNTVNNATRAMRLGQTAAQGIITGMLPLLEPAWEAVAARDPWEFATSTPAADIAMLRHETLYSRLFMS